MAIKDAIKFDINELLSANKLREYDDKVENVQEDQSSSKSEKDSFEINLLNLLRSQSISLALKKWFQQRQSSDYVKSSIKEMIEMILVGAPTIALITISLITFFSSWSFFSTTYWNYSIFLSVILGILCIIGEFTSRKEFKGVVKNNMSLSKKLEVAHSLETYPLIVWMYHSIISGNVKKNDGLQKNILLEIVKQLEEEDINPYQEYSFTEYLKSLGHNVAFSPPNEFYNETISNIVINIDKDFENYRISKESKKLSIEKLQELVKDE